MSEFRVGQGFDTHRFAPDRDLILGGITIQHEQGLAGHSDADVVLHSIIDALLGAAGHGDIGSFFPDTDPKHKDADSKVLFREIWELLSNQEGWKFVNLDLTIITEEPKLRPHIDAMRESIASLLETESSRIGVKATTSEKMGHLGRGEGIAVHTVVLLKQ